MLDLAEIRARLIPLAHQPHVDQRRKAAPKPRAQIKRESNARKKEKRLRNIAVLDMETDPFDRDRPAELIRPFCACLYSDTFEPVIIWNEDIEGFVSEVIAAIERLPDEYTIYAHNGGKFDWQFLLYRLRGTVAFKGRGLMSARIGKHHIRDSFHLLPEKLAAYRKDEFDYKKLLKHRRNKHRDEIIEYLKNDCVYLFELLRHFTGEHGLKLTIAQAARACLVAAGYNVESLAENSDAYLRHFYFGGRVECLSGKGLFHGPYKLIDVNSMYPAAMANFRHPVGRAFTVRDGEPSAETAFIELTCTNHGALVGRGGDGETSAINGRHRFKTTIHEYRMALKLGLITDIDIHWCIDFEAHSDFSNFVVPRYQRRMDLKEEIKGYGDDIENAAYQLAKRNDLTEKYLLNNAYGQYAINPRRFKESYITDYGWRPPVNEDEDQWEPQSEYHDKDDVQRLEDSISVWGELPAVRNSALGYSIWERPTEKLRFRNVATAASITGAARAVLLEAIYNAVDPIYCDTDSLICRDIQNVELHKSKLGAWDLEDTFERVIVAGKKTYACDRGADKPDAKRYKIRSKGTSGLTWQDMETLLNDELDGLLKQNPAPTLSRDGKQVYIKRHIRATAGKPNTALLSAIEKRIANG